MLSSNNNNEEKALLNNESSVNSEEDLFVLLKFIVDYHTCEGAGSSSGVTVDTKHLNETDQSTTTVVASTCQNMQSNDGGTCSLEVNSSSLANDNIMQAEDTHTGSTNQSSIIVNDYCCNHINNITSNEQECMVEDISSDNNSNNSSGSDNYMYKRMVSRHSPHKVHGKYCQIRKGLRKFKNFENNYFVFQLNTNKNSSLSKEQLQQQQQQSQPQHLSCKNYNCQFVTNNDNYSLSNKETFSSLNKIKKQNKQQKESNKNLNNLNYLINVEGNEDNLKTLENANIYLKNSQQQHVTINDESSVILSQQQQPTEMLNYNNSNKKEEEEKEVREEEMNDENVHLFETVPSLEEYLKIENEFIDEINHFH